MEAKVNDSYIPANALTSVGVMQEFAYRVFDTPFPCVCHWGTFCWHPRRGPQSQKLTVWVGLLYLMVSSEVNEGVVKSSFAKIWNHLTRDHLLKVKYLP